MGEIEKTNADYHKQMTLIRRTMKNELWAMGCLLISNVIVSSQSLSSLQLS